MITLEREQEIEVKLKTIAQELVSVVDKLKFDISIDPSCHSNGDGYGWGHFLWVYGGTKKTTDFTTTDSTEGIINAMAKCHDVEDIMGIHDIAEKIKSIGIEIDSICAELMCPVHYNIMYINNQVCVFVNILLGQCYQAHNIDEIDGLLAKCRTERVENERAMLIG